MPNGSTACLVDTNVFIYAYTNQDETKREIAREVLARISDEKIGCVSTQVLNEMFSRLIRGVQEISRIELAERNVSNLIDTWRVLDTTSETVKEAMRGVVRYRMSYWDSLIWAAAKTNGVPYVLSEDFSDGQRIEDVTFSNPFAAGFALAR